MRTMGLEALYRKKNISAKHAENPVYPYLLRNLTIDQPNQTWASDITFLPLARGFVYLDVILDWATRKIIASRLSNTPTVDFCIDALEVALGLYGSAEIFWHRSGQLVHKLAFISVLTDSDIRISMGGKGCWCDNMFVERLWKSIKYKEVYLSAYDSVSEAGTRLAKYIDFYNRHRPHKAIGRVPPDHQYYESLREKKAA